MATASKERAQYRIGRLARVGLDAAGFLDEAAAVLASAVPNGTDHVGGPYWYTLDPGSRLITGVYGGEGCDLDASDVMRWEYLDDDFNKYTEVFGHPRGVQTLHEVTGGRPDRSRIYREYMAPEGIEQELLVALGTEADGYWGAVRLNRPPGQREFDDAELEFMVAVAPELALGIRLGLVVGEASEPDRADAPGLILLDADGEIASVSPAATRWIEELGGEPARGRLPASIAAAASAALLRARGGGGACGHASVVRSLSGRWTSVLGTVIGIARTSGAAVIVEPAHPDHITPLLMAIHGLTAKERDVTRLVLQGWSTEQLARRLSISPHTVQQHLKNIFHKTGVRSRRELTAMLFFDSFDRRVRDNEQRVCDHKPMRGGPLRTQA